MGENTHDKLCAGAKAGHLVPWVLDVRPWDNTCTRNAWTRGEMSDERVIIEDDTKKEETSDETMCTEHLTDSVGEVVNLVDAEGNMLMGEVTISLLPLAVTYCARCW